MANHYHQLPTGFVLALDPESEFPPLDDALTEPNGLIAIGGELSSKRLLQAYRRGIFPWYNAGEPILWWSPNPRMVLFPDELNVSRSLSKILKKSLFEIRVNTAFRDVISACSEVKRPQQSGTWINQDMINAYCELHTLGYAISVESWQDDQLVGGCYGIKINRMFYGESMFHRVSDASKVAFVHLVQYLQSHHVGMIDCQMKTPLLSAFGAREIPRAQFEKHLSFLIQT